jgi:signal transduction histidine kinase
MQTVNFAPDTAKARWQLLLLLATSFALVAVLTMTAIRTDAGGAAGVAGLVVDQGAALVFVAAFAAGVALMVWRTTGEATAKVQDADRELRDLQRALAASEAIIHAEQQALVFWDQGTSPRVVVHNLLSVRGLPSGQAELLRFGDWLEPRAAADLKAALDGLFVDGRAFNLLLKTAVGGHFEADGRAASGRALLRFRDVAGHKRDLVRILEQHRNLTRDIRASRLLLDALPMPAWIRGRDGRLDWVNSAYAAAVDADPAEVVTRQIELLETHQRAEIGRVVGKGGTFRKRDHLVIGGERRPHDLVVVPAGEAFAGAAIDVSALETARGQLDRQVTTYERTLDKVSTAVASFGRDQRLIFFNEAFRRTWQLDAPWLAGQPTHSELLDRLRSLSRLPPQPNYREWKSKQLAIYKTGAERADWWHLPDGRMLRAIAEQRPDGGVTLVFDDATERLSLESRYKTMINVQRETLDSLKEGVAVFGPDGRLKLSNTAFAGIWKLSPEALANDPHINEIVQQARVLHDDERGWQRMLRAVTAVADEREDFSGQMVRADQSVIDYSVTPLPDGATLFTFFDVTSTKQYERALVERNEALVAADRLKNQFISHVSYELRTPLTNIIGFSEMLSSPRTGPLTPKQREYLGDISGSSRTLLSIIDDILDLATIDAGTIELKLAPVDVRGAIESAVGAIRDRAQQSRLLIDIAVAADIQLIEADEARLRQVLYNLLSNAVGFSNAGGCVRVQCWRQQGRIAFMVEDEGVGIPKSELGRVFERFESRTAGSRHRGAGLGLSIVKSLVELHGGDMSLESEAGRGTRVTVRLPERREAENAPQRLARSA